NHTSGRAGEGDGAARVVHHGDGGSVQDGGGIRIRVGARLAAAGGERQRHKADGEQSAQRRAACDRIQKTPSSHELHRETGRVTAPRRARRARWPAAPLPSLEGVIAGANGAGLLARGSSRSPSRSGSVPGSVAYGRSEE